MDMENMKQRAWRAWASAGLLSVLCAVLAVLQSRWIGEVSVAERDRLREQLQTGLRQLSTDFDLRVSTACAALIPDAAQLNQAGRESAYASQYLRWKELQEPWFRRIAIAVPDFGLLNLSMLDLQRAQFLPASWPPEWAPLLDRLNAHLLGEPMRSPSPRENTVIEIPRFGPAIDDYGGPGVEEQEWLIVEINVDYVRGSVIPDLLYRYIGRDYDAEIVVNDEPGVVLYHSIPEN